MTPVGPDPGGKTNTAIGRKTSLISTTVWHSQPHVRKENNCKKKTYHLILAEKWDTI